MGLRIRTNVQSLNSQRNLGYSVQKAGKHMERLSSGYHINKSADDGSCDLRQLKCGYQVTICCP